MIGYGQLLIIVFVVILLFGGAKIPELMRGMGRGGDAETYDFSDIAGQPFHAGADLQLIGDFIRALRDPSRPFLTTIDDSIESHRICYAAERSRRTGETIRMDAAE